MTLAIFFAGMVTGVAGTVSMCALVAAGRADRASDETVRAAERADRLAGWAAMERGRTLADDVLRQDRGET